MLPYLGEEKQNERVWRSHGDIDGEEERDAGKIGWRMLSCKGSRKQIEGSSECSTSNEVATPSVSSLCL